MGTAELKSVIIEKVKSMNKKEAELFFGHILEAENFSDRDFYSKWEDIPEADKKNIEKGISDLQKGKKGSFDSFASSFKKKQHISK